MTPRDRYRRCRAYSRASARWDRVFSKRNPFDPYGTSAAALRTVDRYEAHAWARLPEAARRAIQCPGVTP